MVNKQPVRANLILIDDDLDEAELFFESLQRVRPDLQFKSFTTGADALNFIINGRNTPDFIFLDLNMPMVSGKEVLKRLREHEVSKTIPVVVYSTTISKKDIDDTASYNVMYLQKPDNFDSLCEKLSEIL